MRNTLDVIAENCTGPLKRLAAHAFIIFAAVCVMTSAPRAEQAAPSAYLLGPLDLIRIKAFEWQPARDDVYEWKALNDQFTIGPDGTVSLPFVGDVMAAGCDTAELSRRVADKMKANLGFQKAPSVSVEVVKFRPFYIIGDVRAPGEFPYRPGMTVLQSVSIAGGFYRDNGDQRHYGREMIQSMGEIRVIDVQFLQLRARKARLESELHDQKQITFPDALQKRADEPSVAQVMYQEKLLFDTRSRSFETENKALESLRSFLKDSIGTLAALLATQERQLKLASMEMASVGSLADKGLATASRSLGLQRDIAQLEGDRLKVLNSQNQVQQELSKTDLQIIALRNTRVKDITVDLNQTQEKLDELVQRRKTNEQLWTESSIDVIRTREEMDVQPTYAIVRMSGGRAQELSAGEDTTVQPGDTVKVILPLLAVPDTTQLGASLDAPNSSDRTLAKASPEGPANLPQ